MIKILKINMAYIFSFFCRDMKNNYELKSRDSLCRRRDEILEAIQNNNIPSFRNHLKQIENIYQQYDSQQYKSILDMACSEGRSQIIEELLEFKRDLDINRMNEHHKKCPIHFAIESKDLDTIKILLKNPNLDINIKSRTKGLISFAIKCLNETTEDIQNAIDIYEEIIQELLRAGVDPSIQVTN